MMERLDYAALERAGYTGYLLRNAPVKVLQFGEGNFLRAFADHWFDLANERAGWNGKVMLVQPRGTHPEGVEPFRRQQGLYTLCLRGLENGRPVQEGRVISVVEDCLCPAVDADWQAVLRLARSPQLEYVVSNTTEAGIAYRPGDSAFGPHAPAAFPAKLTRVLYERWRAFEGAADKGLIVLPCELIDNNGRELQRCCAAYAADWALEPDFVAWLHSANTFCSTLVDRIVPGRPRGPETQAAAQVCGCRDELLTVAEPFGVWAIEGPAWLEARLPFAGAGLSEQVFVVPDVTPYKKRKVRILNGAHTGFVPGAYLAGFDIVRDCMQDDVLRGFMNQMLYEEIIPTLPLDPGALRAFAAAVQDRFSNPFIDHALLSICLNSTAKWKARNLPSLLEYRELRGTLPACLVMSLAAYLAFYSSDIQARTAEGLVCRRPQGDVYTVQDEGWVLDRFYALRADGDAALTGAILRDQRMWGMDLAAVPGLEAAVLADLEQIRRTGARAAFAACLQDHV